jgi:hypothetical protein
MNRENGNNHTSDILQYNITSDTLEKISSLSSPTRGGLALKDKDGKYIYYFGGTWTSTVIHRFNPETNATVKLSTVLPSDVVNAAGVTTSQSAFIFNGRYRKIIEFDLATETVDEIGQRSFGNDSVVSTASITDSASNRTWLFSTSWDKFNNPVETFNSETRLTSYPNHDINVPSLYRKPAAVSAGRYGYIIGGIGRETESDGTKHPSRGILR